MKGYELFSPFLGSEDYRISRSLNGTLSNTTREACFSVEVVDDMLFESEVETFSLTIDDSFDVINLSGDSRTLRVANSPSAITISIIDNDRDIVIGFEESKFEVEEGVSLELCVAVMRPTFSEDFNAVINITVATVSGSAGEYAFIFSLSLSLSLFNADFASSQTFLLNVPTVSAGPADYTPISAVDRDTVLLFDNSTRRACFRVEILEDMIFEGQEFFTVQLTPQILFIGTSQGVSLSPSTATITIVAQPIFTVGFGDDSLRRSVREDVGNVTLCVEIFGEGELATDFGVNVDIGGDGTAG